MDFGDFADGSEIQCLGPFQVKMQFEGYACGLRHLAEVHFGLGYAGINAPGACFWGILTHLELFGLF